MDFDTNRNRLLQQLTSQRKQKQRSIENTRAKMRLKEQAQALGTASSKRRGRKKFVLLYGHPGLFLGTVKATLADMAEVVLYNNIDRASEYVLEHHIPLVIMDMDPPSDWRKCHDLFTTGKTMYPDINYIVFQKNKIPEEPVCVLEHQGAHVLTKPLNSAEFTALVEKLVYS
ncbi:hypothetical protein [Chitinivibrio alkaliphilus]|uniref:Response regulatory domain-containing protein n=1 Tax=Chitinivibrio alkaliphilus ACht1 TaxID=1313304 RepID=U7D530_9BACT|nr:hypothetical protein [Chitinivibrio alkaliphilus]ERP31624.1 hypothetical protein CALK_1488 [Chitinivibrio alkaliphilus ACht1]